MAQPAHGKEFSVVSIGTSARALKKEYWRSRAGRTNIVFGSKWLAIEPAIGSKIASPKSKKQIAKSLD
jgi:hypothetical protein